MSVVAGRLRLVATDLDGTLLRNDGTISERTRHSVARLQATGVVFMPVTGRPPRFVRSITEQLALTKAAICANGAIVYDLTADEMLDHFPIAQRDALWLIDALRATIPDIAFAVERGLTFGCDPVYDSLRTVFGVKHELVADAHSLCDQPITKLIVRRGASSAATLYPIIKRVVGSRAAVTYSGPTIIEISARGVDKARTLAHYCARNGISSAEVIAFGDMLNDIPLLRWAGQGVAVANAHAEVLAAADAVTASNMRDGVAAHIEHLLDQLG